MAAWFQPRFQPDLCLFFLTGALCLSAGRGVLRLTRLPRDVFSCGVLPESGGVGTPAETVFTMKKR